MLTVSRDPLVERLRQAVGNRLAPASRGEAYQTPAMIQLALTELEVYRLEAPVGADGYDLGLTAGAAVCQELGRAALPNVYAGPALVLDALAAGGGSPELLVAVAAGQRPIRLAGLDWLGGHRTIRPRLRAEPDGAGHRLSGEVVLDSTDQDGEASVCLPVAGPDGVELVLLPPELARTAAGWVAPGLARLELRRALVEPAALIGRLGSGAPLPDPAGVLARARIRQAAYLLGMAQGAQALGVAHAQRREQFDRRLFDLQSVRLSLARSAVSIRSVQLAVAHAAWLAGREPEIRASAVAATALAAQTAMTAIRTAVQLHGALGLTLAAPIHRFYRLAAREVSRCGPVATLWQEAGWHRLAGGAGPTDPGSDCADQPVAHQRPAAELAETGHAVPA